MRPYRGRMATLRGSGVRRGRRCWLGGGDRPRQSPEGRCRVAEAWTGGDTIVLAQGVRPTVGNREAESRECASSGFFIDFLNYHASLMTKLVRAHEFIRGQDAGGEVQWHFARARLDADGGLFGYVWIDDAVHGQQITERRDSSVPAYDFPTAALLDAAGIEAILVGDTLSMVVQGHDTTLPVTLDQMIYHAEMVGRAVHRALVIVDMPFPTCYLGAQKAVESASRVLKETRCQAVKLEEYRSRPT